MSSSNGILVWVASSGGTLAISGASVAAAIGATVILALGAASCLLLLGVGICWYLATREG
jgi:hypothetical protein